MIQSSRVLCHYPARQHDLYSTQIASRSVSVNYLLPCNLFALGGRFLCATTRFAISFLLSVSYLIFPSLFRRKSRAVFSSVLKHRGSSLFILPPPKKFCLSRISIQSLLSPLALQANFIRMGFCIVLGFLGFPLSVTQVPVAPQQFGAIFTSRLDLPVLQRKPFNRLRGFASRTPFDCFTQPVQSGPLHRSRNLYLPGPQVSRSFLLGFARVANLDPIYIYRTVLSFLPFQFETTDGITNKASVACLRIPDDHTLNYSTQRGLSSWR